MINYFKVALLVLLLSLSCASRAFEPFVIDDIRIEGIERTDPGLIFSNIPVQVGETVDRDVTNQIISEIFKTSRNETVAFPYGGVEQNHISMDRYSN